VSYPQQRDLRAELDAGLTEQTYKRAVRDRGGIVESTTPRMRDDLSDTNFGVHEAAVKVDPFGRPVVTPDTHTGGPVAYPGS
jgi:hypothetical protein